MALSRVIDIIQKADRQGSAVIGFNCIDCATVRAAIWGAEKAGKPVLAVLYPGHRGVISLPAFAAEVRKLAGEAGVPVGMHLDHCSDLDTIREAIDEGFSSVMFDGSLLPLSENIRQTADVVKIAHEAGVAVEGEVGHVGLAEEPLKDDALTAVETAKLFASETGVDMLAVAIGNAHGVYRGTPRLDIGRLREINRAVSTPLVLHGGSGIPTEQLQEALKNGINKFNVATEFFAAYYHAAERYHRENRAGADQLGANEFILAELIAYVENKLADTLGSCGA